MKFLRCLGYWLTRWQTTIVLIAITALFFYGLRSTSELRKEDARIERQAAIRFCESANERTQVIRDFLMAATAPPDPRQFEYIEDDHLREGAIEQARRGRSETRGRVDQTFTLRDCPAEFPPPPEDD